ncbi:MAG: methylenetetrahydrofolate--tRNA-(uracil(54)-C(5))-methyltransferase (FADH(2)-oxidizing) TrmFO [Christensenellales bacterium]
MTKQAVSVIGAGLAGSEAAWQLARRGIPVKLYDMKPGRMSPAHESGLFAELVCSNSLRSDRLQNAVGLLKEEMRRLGSLVLAAADLARVPAGGALAVDREAFSGYITRRLKEHPMISIQSEEVTAFPEAPAIIATGPLTSDRLSEAIQALPEAGMLHFYDAAAPIVMKDSIDMSRAFMASRYGRGDDYINCPLDEGEYRAFHQALLAAETAPVHGFEETLVFEGCMPIESMARRGEMAIAFGPLKPVGLVDPHTGRQPFAVLQLRRDDASDTMYNLVGFQTRLKFPEQRRVFGMVPGLEKAEFARYGVMHRNTFLDSPGFLDSHYGMKSRPGVYFAGQMTGVEGYVESASSGFLAGLSMARRISGQAPIDFPSSTAIGALGRYISTQNRNFQPMNITFGLMDPIKERVRSKEQRCLRIAETSLHVIDAIKKELLAQEGEEVWN